MARAYIPVVIAALSILAAGFYIDRNYYTSNQINLRANATTATNARAAQLQSLIDRDLHAAEVIGTRIASLGTVSYSQFDEFAQDIFSRNPEILQISANGEDSSFRCAARNGEPYVPLPLEQTAGTKKALIDWSDSSANTKLSDIFLVRPSVYGISLTVPVFKTNYGHTERWGFISLIINAESLFESTRVSYRGNGTFHFALRSMKGTDSSFKPFIRTDQVRTVFNSDPVISAIDIRNQKLQLGAIPYGGWENPPKYQTLLRAAIILFSLLLIIPLFFSAKLRLERHLNVEALKTRERELEIVSRRLGLALESYQCGVWEAGILDETVYCDHRMHDLHGTGGQLAWAERKNWIKLIHRDDREQTVQSLHDAIQNRQKFSVQCRIVKPNGEMRHLRYVGQFNEAPGGAQRMFGITIDVSEDVLLNRALLQAKTEAEKKNEELESTLQELSQREGELQETSGRLKLAMDAYQCGIWEADLQTGETYWDERMHDFFGLPYTESIVDAKMWTDGMHPDDRAETVAKADYAIATGERYATTYRVISKDGTLRHIQAVGQRHIGANGLQKFIGIALDVSEDIVKNEALISAKNDAEAKAAELAAVHMRIQHNATHDPLTGLANRRALDEELDRLAQLEASSEGRVTLMHIDLDRFKQINDTLGHAAGDAMLTHAANVLKANTRKVDLVARIGGDEFVILLMSDATNTQISEMARRIIDNINLPVMFEGHECRFGVSIGIARQQGSKNSIRKLLVNADIALYRAKAHGRNRAEFFTASLQADIRRTKKLADEILRGIDNNEFKPWYQPQFCAKTHELVGVEALVRWNHPERGLLVPDAFLKTAEEINAVARLDHLVLENALIDRLYWAADGLIIPKISVNVSARRLRDEQLIKTIRDMSITKGQIAFELVESIFLDDADEVVTRNIKRIKALGIDIEIDDFGTGHTSIVSLLKLEPKRLKIDRQLVSPMLTCARELSLVRSIIEIGASLDIETVAEGVETMEHAVRLKELGCDFLQGYAFSKPLPANEFAVFALNEQWKKTG